MDLRLRRCGRGCEVDSTLCKRLNDIGQSVWCGLLDCVGRLARCKPHIVRTACQETVDDILRSSAIFQFLHLTCVESHRTCAGARFFSIFHLLCVCVCAASSDQLNWSKVSILFQCFKYNAINWFFIKWEIKLECRLGCVCARPMNSSSRSGIRIFDSISAASHKWDNRRD